MSRAASVGGHSPQRRRSPSNAPDAAVVLDQRVSQCESWIRSFEKATAEMPAIKDIQAQVQMLEAKLALVNDNLVQLEQRVSQGDQSLTQLLLKQ